MRTPGITYSQVVISLLIVLSLAASAGDRARVTDALRSIPSNWKDALFSIDVQGASATLDAILDHQLRIGYEAAAPGYLTYVRISSHGEVTISRNAVSKPRQKGEDVYTVKPPLGTEQVIALFSNAPLDQLFPAGTTEREIGGDGQSAEKLVQQIAALETSDVKIAARRYHFTVATVAGGTEYTTRGIEYKVESTRRLYASGSAEVRIPSHIQFEFDSDRLTEQGKHDLDQFGEALVSKMRDSTVVLEGHTDAIGADDYNVSLSLRRADAAKKYLTESFGIPSTRLAADGKGKDNPLKPNDTEDDRSQNRRVDIIFKGSAAPPDNPR
jgi:outer membrane protein OmpA-like peptidoglycan-associated protein